MGNKSRDYSQSVYQEYLTWFKDLASTPTGVKELKARNAYMVYDRDGKELPVTPYPYDMWYIMDQNSGCDFEAMEIRAKQNRLRNKTKISEALKHVGGNPDAPLLNPEYLARAEATKKLREQYKTYTGGSDEISKDILYALRKEHGDLIKLNPVPTTDVTIKVTYKPWGLFKRVLNWFTGPRHVDQTKRERFSSEFKDEMGISDD